VSLDEDKISSGGPHFTKGEGGKNKQKLHTKEKGRKQNGIAYCFIVPLGRPRDNAGVGKEEVFRG